MGFSKDWVRRIGIGLFAAAFLGLAGLKTSRFFGWFCGNPRTSPREPAAIVAFLEEEVKTEEEEVKTEELKILSTERKIEHEKFNDTVEGLASLESMKLANELSTVLPEQEVRILSGTVEELDSPESMKLANELSTVLPEQEVRILSGTVEELDSPESIKKVEELEHILFQIKTQKDLIKVTEAEYAKLSSKVVTISHLLSDSLTEVRRIYETPDLPHLDVFFLLFIKRNR